MSELTQTELNEMKVKYAHTILNMIRSHSVGTFEQGLTKLEEIDAKLKEYNLRTVITISTEERNV